MLFSVDESIVSIMFSVIIFYFTMYQNFNAHELTTIKSCCSFQYGDFSSLTDHYTSVPENTNRERNRSKYENTYFAIVNNMITKLRGEGEDYSVNMIHKENKDNCVPNPLVYASLKHF